MANQNMKLPNFIGIANFAKKRWVFNFQHFRKNGRYHLIVNKNPKIPHPFFSSHWAKSMNNSGFVSLNWPAVTGIIGLKPSFNYAQRSIAQLFPATEWQIKDLHLYILIGIIYAMLKFIECSKRRQYLQRWQLSINHLLFT